MKTAIIIALVAALALVGGWVSAGTVSTTADVEVAVWKHADSGRIYLSTRPAGGHWTTHETPIDLSQRHPQYPAWYQGSAVTVSVAVTVEVSDAPPAPNAARQPCTATHYDRSAWGSYPRAAAGAAPTWTTASDRVNSRVITQDHHVALQDAHVSGGCHWTAAKKDQFSSDTANLNPTTALFNSSKGSRTPDQLTGIAARIIDTAAERCDYATQHRDVKRAWGLTMTASESATVDAWLADCTRPASSDEPTVETQTQTEEAGYWHAHCARNRVSGGCDRRFRPSHYPRHWHPDSVPRHNSGEHEDD